MQYNSNLVLTPALKRQLEPELIHLIQDSLTLLSHFSEPDHRASLHDYAFMVFPMAKAYEGFLKQFFVDLGVTKEYHAKSRRFRIGRSFNPDLPDKLRDEVWLYDDVAARCGPERTRDMWQIWIDGRNHTFHYFPDERHNLTYAQAERLIERFLEAMEQAVACPKYPVAK